MTGNPQNDPENNALLNTALTAWLIGEGCSGIGCGIVLFLLGLILFIAVIAGVCASGG